MVEHEGQEDPQGASSYSDFSAELADKLLAEQASVGLTSDDLVLAGMIKSGQKLSDFVFAKLMFGESLQEEAFKDFFNYLPESDGYNLEEISRDVFSTDEETKIRLATCQGHNRDQSGVIEQARVSTEFRSFVMEIINGVSDQSVVEWDGSDLGIFKKIASSLDDVEPFLNGEPELINIRGKKHWGLKSAVRNNPNEPKRNPRYLIVTSKVLDRQLTQQVLGSLELKRLLIREALADVQYFHKNSLYHEIRMFGNEKRDLILAEAKKINNKVKLGFFNKLLLDLKNPLATSRLLEIIKVMRDDRDVANFPDGQKIFQHPTSRDRGELRFEVSLSGELELEFDWAEDSPVRAKITNSESTFKVNNESPKIHKLFVRKIHDSAEELQYAFTKANAIKKIWLSERAMSDSMLFLIQELFRGLEIADPDEMIRLGKDSAPFFERILAELLACKTSSEYLNILKSLNLANYPYTELIIMPKPSAVKLIISDALRPQMGRYN